MLRVYYCKKSLKNKNVKIRKIVKIKNVKHLLKIKKLEKIKYDTIKKIIWCAQEKSFLKRENL